MKKIFKAKIKSWWGARGIQFKFIFSVLSLFVVGVVALSAFFTTRTQTLLDENLKQKLNLLENNFSVIVKNSLLESSYSTLNTLIKLISQRDKELLHIVVMDKSYNILATSSEKKYPIFYRFSEPSIMKKIENRSEEIFTDNSRDLLGKLKIIYSQDNIGNTDDTDDIGEETFEDDSFDLEDDFSSDVEGDVNIDDSTTNIGDEKPPDSDDNLESSHNEALSEIEEGSQSLEQEEKDPLRDIQGYVYIALTKKYLKAEINQIWLISIISLMLILSLGAFVAYIIGSGLAKPLAFLANKVREIAKGNLNAVIQKIDRKDEIGQLVLNTEDMRLSIKSLTENLEEKVEERTHQLQIAQNENEKILDTMQTGLFSIDARYVIGSQYSKITEQFFEMQNLVDINIFEVIKRFLDSEKLRMTDKYFTILFNETINDTFIYDLNPLQKVEAKFKENMIKYLEFYFERIYVNKKIVGIMIIVDDVTEAYLLNKRLETNQKKLDSQMSQLAAILNTDTQSLGMFITDTSEDITELREIIKNKNFSQENMSHIYRIVHSIKGNAALLNLSLISDIAHSGEEEIILMQKKDDIIAVDITRIHRLIGELDQALKQVNELIAKLQSFKSGLAQNFDPNLLMLESIEKIVDRLSKVMEKGVKFNYDKFDVTLINDQNRKVIKDILIQLIRNSINHGLETYAERKKLGKPLDGTILLASEKKDNGFFTMILSDDGQGLSVDKLRNKAMSMNKEKFKNIASWNDEKLRELIFEPGFSTQEVANLTAGRGIGMDIIKKETEDLGGRITLESEMGKYFRMRLNFPYALKG